jgi:phosphoglycerate dehydrogenase-like enzyme
MARRALIAAPAMNATPTPQAMSKTNLLVISAPGHYALRYLAPLRDSTTMSVSDDRAELAKLLPAAEVILVGLAEGSVKLADIWRQAKSVRWVHSLSAGVEKMLFPELVESDVPLTNARGVFKRSLAEFVILGILFHYKKVRRLIENQRRHAWDEFYVQLMGERVMGVVGYGEIGRECALQAKGMGMKIHAVRRNPERSANDPTLNRVFGPQELPEMLAGIDVLVCAAPLTPHTHHMISDQQFAMMKPTAIVINVGRGPVIDEAAMIRALQQRRIAGASLDVFEEEPLPENSPLWNMENVLISPHCTDRTEDPDWLELSMRAFIENFHRYQKGECLENIVDKRAGY